MRRICSSLLLVVALGVGAAASACAGTTTTTNGAPAGSGPPGSAPSGQSPGTTVAVQKDTLAVEKDPPGAPGRTLTLMRYTIAPGAKLSPHIHPGVQLASIEAGTLTYTVISGSATLTPSGGTPETITGPTTVSLHRGDAIAENDGMVHFGANETSEPVVILATLLTDSNQDLAVTVTTAAAPGTTAG